jgi:hypothetical protein
LRQNKAIDRNLFVDLLSRVGRYRNISDYHYIGFGGPFLEDFKHVHAALRMTKMTSIEIDENVSKRQNFNRPLSCVEVRNESSGDFISGFDFSEDYVFWLDYTEPSKVGEQLAELETLISKLPSGSIFKITVNAAAAALGVSPPGEDLQVFRVRRAGELLGAYAPAVISTDDVTSKSYPNVLLKSIESAVKKGVAGRKGYVALPLTSFTYKDGQTMLAVTGVVLRKSDEPAFMQHTRLSHWEFATNSWALIKEISVPAMSVKERIFVESLLPQTSAEEIELKIGFHIGEDSVESSRLISNFSKYYRMYPWYSRIAM